MTHHRLPSLRMAAISALAICGVCSFVAPGRAQNSAAQSAPVSNASQQNAPRNPAPQNPPAQNPPGQNPFENVPTAPEKPNQPAPPSGVQESKTAPVGENIIEAVEFRGQHKVPQDTLRALIYTKKGDVYEIGRASCRERV